MAKNFQNVKLRNIIVGNPKMKNYLTYLYLLTPLHTGGSSDEGNLMGIAREVHTEFPYLPASSLRGKIRAEIEYLSQLHNPTITPTQVSQFFGQKIEGGQQPTEGEVWFADASLLFFPIASLSHHLVWVTCPLWLERWNRWLPNNPLTELIIKWQNMLSEVTPALVSFQTESIYLQTALLDQTQIQKIETNALFTHLQVITGHPIINQLLNKLIILSNEDCIALVETGLQREVRVALNTTSKTVKGGSFRSEEAIPPETVLFFPWDTKRIKQGNTKEDNLTDQIRQEIISMLQQKLQFGGLEGLGRGWSQMITIEPKI
jgi:CRISPR-associated protein Cmr4